VKVIAYDRPIPAKPADFYVSFDNEGIGNAIAESLVEHTEVRRRGRWLRRAADQRFADRRGRRPHQGGHPSRSEGFRLQDLAEYDTPEWAPPKAQEWAAGQITRFGADIKGVVAANDGTGGGAIAAFKAAGVNPVPPVTGNDATIAALQLIISGDQYNTISKPSEIVAAAAAKVAFQLLKGETPEAETSSTTRHRALRARPCHAQNIKAEIFDKKIQTAAELCTGEYAEGCKKLGIQ
jgi:D-xylose transport system substrate-binding protein